MTGESESDWFGIISWLVAIIVVRLAIGAVAGGPELARECHAVHGIDVGFCAVWGTPAENRHYIVSMEALL